MSSTSRNRNLIFIIAALLLTNLAVLVYFLYIKETGKRPPSAAERNRSGLTGILQKEVGFNDEQISKYRELKDKQWQTIRPLFDDMRKAKSNLFHLLAVPDAGDSLIRKTADIIGQKQIAMDLQTFAHFKAVRTLCTTDQQPKYDSVISEMFSKMGRPEHKKEKGKEEKSR